MEKIYNITNFSSRLLRYDQKLWYKLRNQTQGINIVKEIDMYYITDIKRSVAQYTQAATNIGKTWKHP